MNKLVLFLFLCMSTAMSAQIFTSVSLRKIAGETASDTRIAGISPAGDYVLTTTLGNKGLKKLDMSTGREEVLTTAAGAGVGAVVSDDGSEVVFREVHFTTDEHVRMTWDAISGDVLPEVQIPREPKEETAYYRYNQN